MKNIILLIALCLVAAYSHADEKKDNWEDCKLNDDGYCIVEKETLQEETVKEKTPKQYKDSKIRRKMKDGRIQEFDGDNFKIVPRTQKRYKKKVEKKIVRPVIINKQKRHHINLLVGVAPDADFSRADRTPNRNVIVEHESDLHLGLSYSYDLLELSDDLDLSIGGQIQTNESFFGSIGVSF